MDDEGFTYRKSRKINSPEPPATPSRKSVFSCITPTALRDIEQVVANGPPNRSGATPLSVNILTHALPLLSTNR